MDEIQSSVGRRSIRSFSLELLAGLLMAMAIAAVPVATAQLPLEPKQVVEQRFTQVMRAIAPLKNFDELMLWLDEVSGSYVFLPGAPELVRLPVGHDESHQPYDVFARVDPETLDILWTGAQYPGMRADDFVNYYKFWVKAADARKHPPPFSKEEVFALTYPHYPVVKVTVVEMENDDGTGKVYFCFEAHVFADGKFVLFKYTGRGELLDIKTIDSLAEMPGANVGAAGAVDSAETVPSSCATLLASSQNSFQKINAG